MIKSLLMYVKTDLGFTYTIDYKQDAQWYAVLEYNVHFNDLEDVLQWINTREKELVQYNEGF